MLNRYEERSACAFVPYLSHRTFVRVEMWLRGARKSVFTSSTDSRTFDPMLTAISR